MASEKPPKRAVHGTSEAGIAAKHPRPEPFQMLVAPTTDAELNVVRRPLIPIGCWRVDDVRFEFDSSFVLPSVREEMRILADLIRTIFKESGRQPPISIFGHADPVGKDEYNKFLSGRRAAAIYGMLTRRDEIWEDLFNNQARFTQPVAGDKWGTKSLQIMLNEVAGPVAVDGVLGQKNRSAIREFQTRNGLSVDGEPGPATRKTLFLAYMDALCVDRDDRPFQIDRNEGFLTQGQDTAGKGDYQGCGEFNPILIFSQVDQDKFEQQHDKAERNAANEPNRRVMTLLFRPGSRVAPAAWPCPRAKEGPAGCRKRFWSDAEKRRSTRLPDTARKFEDTRDTFACRFYQRLSGSSPCDLARKSFRIRLYDGFGNAIPFAPFMAKIGSGDFSALSRADAEGHITLRDVEVPASCVIQWGVQPEEGQSVALVFSRTIFLVGDDETGPPAASKQLNNLGYDGEDQRQNVLGFQLDYGHLATPPLSPTGELDERTLELLATVYRQSAAALGDTVVA